MYLICLHNVVPGPLDAFDAKCSRITPEELETFIERTSLAFDLVPFGEYLSALRSGTGHDRLVALSFDDGFLGVHDHAAPILHSHALTAAAFINPPFLGNPPDRIFHFLEIEIAFRQTQRSAAELSFLDTPLDLSDTAARVKAMKRVKKRLKTIPEADRATGHAELLTALGADRARLLDQARAEYRFRVMDADQVRALHAAGWTIGSHAMTHRTLAMLDPVEITAELEDARDALRTGFGWSDLPFAYPYGDRVHVGTLAPDHCKAAGYPMAFTTQPGPSDFANAPHLLPRVDYKVFLGDLP